jgi:hypothetical protein
MVSEIIFIVCFAVLVLIILITVLIILKLNKKKNGERAVYDERQVLARGFAFKSAFFTAATYMSLCAFIYTLNLKWIEPVEAMIIGVVLSCAVCIIIAIFKDAYFHKHQNRIAITIALFIVGAFNSMIFVMNQIIFSDEDLFVSEYIINSSHDNLIVGLFLLVVAIATLIKIIIDKREVTEE